VEAINISEGRESGKRERQKEGEGIMKQKAIGDVEERLCH